ncbi:MAG: tRNA lysidine(34) synthetase TilS [Candidatus Saccharimonadales bacterium]
MTYVVAVSGGVDSVVLLDMLLAKGTKDIIVAHFDHGIRPESAADARFVGGLAAQYGVLFEMVREELGTTVSENVARTRRYAFLRDVAVKHGAQLITAHHSDDIVESIAINLTRGTGWRGLAVMGDLSIYRPLLNYTKQQLYDYALVHQLEWIEDETNSSTRYLRNRLRRRLRSQLRIETHEQLLELRQRQLELRRVIEEELRTLIHPNERLLRYFFIMVPTECALEMLRYVTNGRLTMPQLWLALKAIKTAKAGATIEAGSGVVIQFGQRYFVVETPQ